MKKLAIVVVLIFISGLPAYADYTETRTLQAEADGITDLQITCGAGFLEVEGVDSLTSIEVEAEIILENVSDTKAEQIIEDYMDLSLETRGSRVILVSKFEDTDFLSTIFNSDRSMLINLTVRLPRNIELSVDDGSGYIDIRNIDKDITIDDGSGEISIADVGGSLDLDDGSGDVEAKNMGGDIKIDDGSGDLDISDITGDVDINDGSGNIYVSHIDGSVIVDDGSGDIKIDRVSEDVKIIDDGSGHCSITNVDGDVDD